MAKLRTILLMVHNHTSRRTDEDPVITPLDIDEPILKQASSALFTEGEKVTFRGHLHFMMGFRWLALALLCLSIGAYTAFGSLTLHPAEQPDVLRRLITLTATFAGFCLLIWYLIPFWRSFMVITNQRALIGVGHFTSVHEQILPYQLEDWEIRQNIFESMLGYGHLTLRLTEGRQLRIIFLPYIAHPHQFMHHLEQLCPPDIRASSSRIAISPTESITTNKESAPPGGGPTP